MRRIVDRLVQNQPFPGLFARSPRLATRLSLAIHSTNVRVTLPQILDQLCIGNPDQPLLLLTALLLSQLFRKSKHHA